MITHQALIEQARALVGTPWVHQGRSQWGVDCIGLLKLAADRAGLDLVTLLAVPDRRNYSRHAEESSITLVATHCTRIAEPVSGCLIVCKFPGDEWPKHFGLATAEGNIIHADARARRVAEVGYRGMWKRLEHSLWLIPGVDYGA